MGLRGNGNGSDCDRSSAKGGGPPQKMPKAGRVKPEQAELRKDETRPVQL